MTPESARRAATLSGEAGFKVKRSEVRMYITNSRVSGMPATLWSQHREASLNWLALGLLLAAWNAVDDGDSARRRPESLRAYAHVTVRAVARNDASRP
jgi:hypothetical protein